jgi:hypothetical protein
MTNVLVQGVYLDYVLYQMECRIERVGGAYVRVVGESLNQVCRTHFAFSGCQGGNIRRDVTPALLIRINRHTDKCCTQTDLLYRIQEATTF